jgi:putative ABC transport system permease protein
MTMRWGLDLDVRVFLMAVAVTLCTGVLAGIGPALSASGLALQARLREGGRAGTSRGGRRIRSGLVVVQVAASVVVMVCAGLFVVSARQAERVDLGFKPDHLLSLGLDASLARYDRAAATAGLVRIERAVAAVPGVQAVSWSTTVPIKKGASDLVEVQSEVATQAGRTGTVTLFSGAVGPSYFATMGIPILEGRAFTEADDSTSDGVVILNQLAAETLFPGQPAIGRTVRLSKGGAPLEVVGIARNGLYMIIAEAPRAYAYVPMAQRYQPWVYLTVRTATDPDGMIPAIRTAIASADRDLVPFDAQSLPQTLETSPNGMVIFRVAAGFATAIGMVAVALTLVGLYGVISYSVSQRTQEIGLRMALGASRETVIRSILVDGARLAGIGISVGLVGAVLLTRVLSNFLVGARSLDGLILGGVALGLGVAALASAYLPARRAARIDPVSAIRSA